MLLKNTHTHNWGPSALWSKQGGIWSLLPSQQGWGCGQHKWGALGKQIKKACTLKILQAWSHLHSAAGELREAPGSHRKTKTRKKGKLAFFIVPKPFNSCVPNPLAGTCPPPKGSMGWQDEVPGVWAVGRGHEGDWKIPARWLERTWGRGVPDSMTLSFRSKTGTRKIPSWHPNRLSEKVICCLQVSIWTQMLLTTSWKTALYYTLLLLHGVNLKLILDPPYLLPYPFTRLPSQPDIWRRGEYLIYGDLKKRCALIPTSQQFWHPKIPTT